MEKYQKFDNLLVNFNSVEAGRTSKVLVKVLKNKMGLPLCIQQIFDSLVLSAQQSKVRLQIEYGEK